MASSIQTPYGKLEYQIGLIATNGQTLKCESTFTVEASEEWRKKFQELQAASPKPPIQNAEGLGFTIQSFSSQAYSEMKKKFPLSYEITIQKPFESTNGITIASILVDIQCFLEEKAINILLEKLGKNETKEASIITKMKAKNGIFTFTLKNIWIDFDAENQKKLNSNEFGSIEQSKSSVLGDLQSVRNNLKLIDGSCVLSSKEMDKGAKVKIAIPLSNKALPKLDKENPFHQLWLACQTAARKEDLDSADLSYLISLTPMLSLRPEENPRITNSDIDETFSLIKRTPEDTLSRE